MSSENNLSESTVGDTSVELRIGSKIPIKFAAKSTAEVNITYPPVIHYGPRIKDRFWPGFPEIRCSVFVDDNPIESHLISPIEVDHDYYKGVAHHDSAIIVTRQTVDDRIEDVILKMGSGECLIEFWLVLRPPFRPTEPPKKEVELWTPLPSDFSLWRDEARRYYLDGTITMTSSEAEWERKSYE